MEHVDVIRAHVDTTAQVLVDVFRINAGKVLALTRLIPCEDR